jgi:signal transduction histidine kinase
MNMLGMEMEVRGQRQLQLQLMANIAHDLRTPLTAMITHAEILRDGILGAMPARQLDSVGAIIRGGQEVLGMIGEILTAARASADQLPLSPSTFEPGEAIRQVAALNEALVARHELTLVVDAPMLPPITADRGRFAHILENLVGNAITYTPKGGRIWITARERGGELLVEVGDTGIGIASEHLEYVFEEFAQVDTSPSRTHHGTGLGLTIARRLVELHGGRIWVESAIDRGSRFFFTIPWRVS